MTENTTTALAIVEGGKHPKPAMVAGAAPRAIVPVSFEEAYRIGEEVLPLLGRTAAAQPLLEAAE